MIVSEVRIQNFRNLEAPRLEFSPTVNLLLGANGQGKTNLLESLNFISLGRSHRGARNEDLIRLDAEHLHVAVVVEEEEGGETTFEYGLQRGGGRRLRIDGRPVPRRSQLVGRFASVFFSPESIALVRGGPDRRRRFVDQGLSALDGAYLESLQSYQKSLRQKARLLRDARGGFPSRAQVEEEVRAWNRQLARHAAVVCLGRMSYIDMIQPFARSLYAELAGSDEEMILRYRPSLEAARAGLSGEQLERDILAEIDYIGQDEIRRGRPLSGPHMDDLEVRLADLDLRTFGSQGETRTAAISLILAQSDVVYARRKVRPVLFFDDIFSELDRSRAQHLQDLAIRQHQIFIATARPEDVGGWEPEGMKVWHVRNGGFEAVT